MLQGAYTTHGLQTVVLGSTYYSETEAGAFEFRKKIEAFPTWESLIAAVNSWPIPTPRPEPHLSDGMRGKSGVYWIIAHD